MKKLLSSLLLLSALASGQILSIATGSLVPVGNYSADKYYQDGIARPLDPTIGTGIYQTTRYSNVTPFSYHIPVPVGIYSVALRLSDPTSTAAGQREFTVAVNGQKTAPIDIFATVGAKTPYTPPQLIAVAATGFIDLVFQPLVGNATVSGIDIYPYTLEVVTDTKTAIQVGSQLITLMCTAGQPCTLSADLTMLMVRVPAPTAPGPCQGLEFAIDASGHAYICGPNKTWLKNPETWSSTF